MAQATILLLTSDDSLKDLAASLEEAGHLIKSVVVGSTGLVDALDQAANEPPGGVARLGYDLILTDLKFGGEPREEIIGAVKARFGSALVAAMTEAAEIRQAVGAIKAGAADYLVKPVRLEAVLSLVDQTVRVSGDEFPGWQFPFGRIVGQSRAIQKVIDIIAKVARADSTVLVTGESGTGKELVARAIHYTSPRANHPLVPVNCGAIPEELLESELFGHEKGSFTNAIRTRIGRFEVADGGTIFLDEIGEMSPKLQVKLLRVLQEKQFERIGSTKTISCDIRIIAATNQDLPKLVERGDFREDLFYRLNVIPIDVPPLRDRMEDVSPLVMFFLNQFRQTKQSLVNAIDPEAVRELEKYSWPGNIRELENLVERMVILADGDTIGVADLPERVTNVSTAPGQNGFVLPDEGFSVTDHLNQIEDGLIRQALSKTAGVKSQAAKMLGLNRTTLVEKMKKKGLG